MSAIIRSAIILKSRNLLALRNWVGNSARFEHAKLDKTSHRVDNLEKRFLVWTGKYKTIAEVPDYVAQNVMERARNRMRIKIANYMMAATVLGCVLMAYLGKRAAARGDSVIKQNLEWHRKYKEDAEKQETANKA